MASVITMSRRTPSGRRRRTRCTHKPKKPPKLMVKRTIRGSGEARGGTTGGDHGSFKNTTSCVFVRGALITTDKIHVQIKTRRHEACGCYLLLPALPSTSNTATPASKVGDGDLSAWLLTGFTKSLSCGSLPGPASASGLAASQISLNISKSTCGKRHKSTIGSWGQSPQRNMLKFRQTLSKVGFKTRVLNPYG